MADEIRLQELLDKLDDVENAILSETMDTLSGSLVSKGMRAKLVVAEDAVFAARQATSSSDWSYGRPSLASR